jgi:ubiquinone/menaquinone biosynthesis C-methylase UbiE
MYRAQTQYLKEIEENARVLILGGGTGWLLAELLSVNPSCSVVYIDASKKMIQKARHKVGLLTQKVSFIHGTEKDIPQGSSFDVIITHFYLDLFDPPTCRQVSGIIRKFCHRRSLWLACDFINVTWWHTAMLWVMYAFFRVTSKLRTKGMPDWRKSIRGAGFSEIRAEYFFRKFICSALYRPSAMKQFSEV